MNDIFFNQIIRYIPYIKRKDIRNEYSFYINRIISEYAKTPNDFKIDDKMIIVILQLSFLVREVIAPLANAASFRSKLLKYDINTIKSGRLSFGNEQQKEIEQIIKEFSGIISLIKSDYNVIDDALSFETIDDFLNIWKKDKN